MTPIPDPDAVPRREYLKAAVAVGGAAGLSACTEALGDDDLEGVPQGDGSELPTRQHAWNDALPRDDHGNVEPPTHHVLRYLDLSADATADLDASRETFADGLADLERAFEWSNEGLLFTVGYSPAYFDRFDEPLPESVDLPEPAALTSLEDPAFDTADVLIHFASDRADAALAAEAALLGDESSANGVAITNCAELFDPVDRRTGFLGPGLPLEHRDASGIPDDAPIPEEAPLFMGFKNGFRESQATEDRVTIDEGPFAGGTTQHVSKLDTQLHQWWTQESHEQRVAKMFSPTHAAEERVGEWGEKLRDSPGVADLPEDAIEFAREEGVVGHAQKAARAREDGEPLLLRRDFPTTDGDSTGLHFLSLQSRISEFVAVREAMTGEDIASDTGVRSRINNGILQYVFVERRGNYLVPPRAHRELPTTTPGTE